MRFLFLLFIIIPIIEITVLIQVGQAIGAWYTVGLVLLSAFIGVNMLRHQGLSTLMRARQRMDQGEMPGQEMVEGIVLAVGGALLVTPGFVTDVIGFSCLVPAVRQRLVKSLLSRATVITRTQSGQTQFHEEYHSTQGPRDIPPREGDVIDGEYTRRD